LIGLYRLSKELKIDGKARNLSDLYCLYQFYSVQYRFDDGCDFALNQGISLKMTNQKLLKDSIETIKKLRTELHNDIDSSKREELDQIIKDLESYKNRQVLANQIINLFGRALAIIPILEKVLDEFNK